MSFDVHFFAPAPVELRRIVDHCPTCERRTRKVAVRTACGWLGWEVTCCACGERWQDGESCPRPFERGWRQRSAGHARDLWRRGQV